jgi:PBP1b-binding outer membrane lipoprotein LpoB
MRKETIISALVLLALLLGACGPAAPTSPAVTPAPTQLAAPTPATGPALPVFAAYDEPIVNVAPAVAHEPIAADLS